MGSCVRVCVCDTERVYVCDTVCTCTARVCVTHNANARNTRAVHKHTQMCNSMCTCVTHTQCVSVSMCVCVSIRPVGSNFRLDRWAAGQGMIDVGAG